MPRVIETDLCIVGSGISAAMLAEKISEERQARVLVVEAGNKIFNFEDRFETRRRFLAYGENPWPDDHIPDQKAEGTISPTMAVGGWGLHWGGVTNRFSAEDLRLKSLYGIGDDWPIEWEEFERYTCEAERRMGVAGVQGPPELDPRSEPYPMPPLPLTYNLELFRQWGEKAGIPFWSTPSAKNTVPYAGREVCARCNTCHVCPTGAKYSPDFTFASLLAAKQIELHDRTLVRRLVLEDKTDRIAYAEAVGYDRPDETLEIRARVFVLASGYTWAPHLLLLSASERFPQGLANRSGLVGRYMNGHRAVQAFIKLPIRVYPGMNPQHSLLSRKFMRPGKLDRYLRHDLRIWETEFQREARPRNELGRVLLGDELLNDWRKRTVSGCARMRAYYDVLPDRDSALTLDAARRNRFGDPLPRIEFRDSEASAALRAYSEERIIEVFQSMARAGGGEVLSIQKGELNEHPGGGCRMGDDPEKSVCDASGRTHNHENLYVIGSPTCVTGGCTNGTLTFAALALLQGARLAEVFPARAKPEKAAPRMPTREI
jgi:quinoprotein glucose dehydrogenase